MEKKLFVYKNKVLNKHCNYHFAPNIETCHVRNILTKYINFIFLKIGHLL